MSETLVAAPASPLPYPTILTKTDTGVSIFRLRGGDEVTVDGSLYKGVATVTAAMYDPPATPMALSADWKANEPFPQVRVRKPDGKVLHYNGDDLAKRRVVFLRAGPVAMGASPASSTRKALSKDRILEAIVKAYANPGKARALGAEIDLYLREDVEVFNSIVSRVLFHGIPTHIFIFAGGVYTLEPYGYSSGEYYVKYHGAYPSEGAEIGITSPVQTESTTEAS